MIKEKIIIALDVQTIKEEERLLDILSPYIRIFKVGTELFYSCGPKAIDIVKKYDREVFLDLKLHDIPNTAYASAKAITKLGVFMFNVHAQGGKEMMRQTLDGAQEESQHLGIEPPKILGVTLLTSIDQVILQEIGIDKSTQDYVLNLAKLVKETGLDGVIASPNEITLIRENLGKDFLIVSPGIRIEQSDTNDQKRISTPSQAIQKGADYIVIGRPITKAKDPVTTLKNIVTD